MRRLSTLSAVLFLLTAGAVAQKRGLLPVDYYNEIGVSSVAMSPTGEYVAFTVTTILEEENKRHREVWMQRLRDGAPDGEPLRFTDPTQESSSPRWSPDGAVLAFSSRRGKDRNSIWFVRIDRPAGEAQHIEGVDSMPTWSPDGKWIAFTRAPEEEEEDNKKNPREGWIAPDAISKTLDAKRFDGRVVTSMRYKRDGALVFRPHYSIAKKSQLFIVPAEGGETRQITEMPFNVGGIVWSPDSKTILFSGNERQDDEYNKEQTADIYAVSIAGGKPKVLTKNPGSERSPSFSPDGTKLVFTFSKERGAETDIMVVDVAADGTFKGEPKNLTAEFDNGPRGPAWKKDGSAIIFGAGIGGNGHLFEVSLDGVVKQITQGDRRLGGYSVTKDGKFMAYTATDAVTPAELYVSRAEGSGETRLTHFNDDWLEEVTLMPAEVLHWKVADGSNIEGWVIKPVGYRADKKYPLILKIHGGPHGAYGNTFFRTFHVLSNAGFFVLYPNPRGSTGYGHKFTYATRGKWGELDQEDYLGGVEAAIKKYPAIDPRRVGVSGGSYGGYMTNWLTATTDRFAAAVTSRSITNWESWWGTSDLQSLTEFEFYGSPWEQRELYRRLSPISYVENVKAPTLIIHSENDYRTPIGDGEQWFMSLMKRKIPVELVRYPRSSHGLSRSGEPWLLVDRLERLRSWFVYWLIENPEKSPAYKTN